MGRYFPAVSAQWVEQAGALSLSDLSQAVSFPRIPPAFQSGRQASEGGQLQGQKKPVA